VNWGQGVGLAQSYLCEEPSLSWCGDWSGGSHVKDGHRYKGIQTVCFIFIDLESISRLFVLLWPFVHHLITQTPVDSLDSLILLAKFFGMIFVSLLLALKACLESIKNHLRKKISGITMQV